MRDDSPALRRVLPEASPLPFSYALPPVLRYALLPVIALIGLVIGVLAAPWPSLDEPAAPVVSQATAFVSTRGGAADSTTPGRSRKAYMRAISERSLFDHTKVGKASVDGEPAEEAVTDGEDLDLILMTVVVAEPERYSSALIRRDAGNARALGYAVGDKVHGGHEIIEIRTDSVLLETPQGNRVVLEPRETEEQPRRRRARRGKGKKGDGRIHKVGKHHYQVDSKLIDEVLSDPKGLRKLGRARAYKRNGEMVGFRLYRIRRGSLGRQIGLRSGDIVTEVNGRPIKSTQDAMALYGAMRNARELEVKVQRSRGRAKRTIKLDML